MKWDYLFCVYLAIGCLTATLQIMVIEESDCAEENFYNYSMALLESMVAWPKTWGNCLYSILERSKCV